MSDFKQTVPMYRMPTHFGLTPGPRQGPDGQPFDWTEQPKRTLAVARYLTDEKALSGLLPPGFVLDGEPVVSVEVQYWTELEWLAGRGYNTLGVKVPVIYEGVQRNYCGAFLAVLWENMPDAIISGREELGYNKLYAEIPAPCILRGSQRYSASWQGHPFVEMELSNLTQVDSSAAVKVPGDGILHHKYIPRTGCPGQADADYITLTPPTGGKTRFLECHHADAKVRFLPATWQQLPTLHHIVNTLAALPVLESRGGFWGRSVGAKDLSDQIIVE